MSALECSLPRFLCKIGQGVNAEVWKGEWNGQYAIKTALPKPGAAEALRQEVAMIKRCQHPHIVVFLGEITGHLVLELLMGDLADVRLFNGLLPAPVVKTACAEVLGALSWMHLQGIAHRDVKPQNVLVSSLDPPFTTKLSDMGCAVEVPATLLTRCVGTRAYQAPEVQLGRYGMKVDIWAMRLVIYFLLYDAIPWRVDGVLEEHIARHVEWRKLGRSCSYKALRWLGSRQLARKASFAA